LLKLGSPGVSGMLVNCHTVASISKDNTVWIISTKRELYATLLLPNFQVKVKPFVQYEATLALRSCQHEVHWSCQPREQWGCTKGPSAGVATEWWPADDSQRCKPCGRLVPSLWSAKRRVVPERRNGSQRYRRTGCSPKKEVKQDLDKDFLNNLGLHTCCTEITLHCVSVSN